MMVLYRARQELCFLRLFQYCRGAWSEYTSTCFPYT